MISYYAKTIFNRIFSFYVKITGKSAINIQRTARVIGCSGKLGREARRNSALKEIGALPDVGVYWVWVMIPGSGSRG